MSNQNAEITKKELLEHSARLETTSYHIEMITNVLSNMEYLRKKGDAEGFDTTIATGALSSINESLDGIIREVRSISEKLYQE